MTGDGVLEFTVPDLGEGLEDATITSWQVAVGDEWQHQPGVVHGGDNKASRDPQPYAGRIVELGGAEGETLPWERRWCASQHRRRGAQARARRLRPDDAMDGSRRRPRAKPPVRKLAAELHVDWPPSHRVPAPTASSPAMTSSPR